MRRGSELRHKVYCAISLSRPSESKVSATNGTVAWIAQLHRGRMILPSSVCDSYRAAGGGSLSLYGFLMTPSKRETWDRVSRNGQSIDFPAATTGLINCTLNWRRFGEKRNWDDFNSELSFRGRAPSVSRRCGAGREACGGGGRRQRRTLQVPRLWSHPG